MWMVWVRNYVLICMGSSVLLRCAGPLFVGAWFLLIFGLGFGSISRDESCNDFIPGLNNCLRDVNVTLTSRKQLLLQVFNHRITPAEGCLYRRKLENNIVIESHINFSRRGYLVLSLDTCTYGLTD